MAVLQTEIIVRAVHVGWNHTTKVVTLFPIQLAQEPQHSFCVRIPVVGHVRRAIVQLGWVKWVQVGFGPDVPFLHHGRRLGKDARRQTSNQLTHLVLGASLDHIHIHGHVVLKHLNLGSLVFEKAAHTRRQVDDYIWPVCCKQSVNLCHVAQITLFGTQKPSVDMGVHLEFMWDHGLQGATNEPGAASD